MRFLGSSLLTLALGASVTIKGNTGPTGQTSFLGSLWYVGAAIHTESHRCLLRSFPQGDTNELTLNVKPTSTGPVNIYFLDDEEGQYQSLLKLQAEGTNLTCAQLNALKDPLEYDNVGKKTFKET